MNTWIFASSYYPLAINVLAGVLAVPAVWHGNWFTESDISLPNERIEQWDRLH